MIAILALIRGRMLLPLLLAVFALWLLWWLLTQALPLWRNNRAYRGKYYTLTDQRIPYRRDKTEDERFFILTLFAIAHEIEAMGQYSGSLMRVQLAVGLPPAHFGVQAKRFINYFNGRGAVAFQFKGKPYAIFIENTACFPQSFSAAAATVKNLASFPQSAGGRYRRLYGGLCAFAERCAGHGSL